MRHSIWLDDVRDPPDGCRCGGQLIEHAKQLGSDKRPCQLIVCGCTDYVNSWTVFRTAEAMLAFIEEVGLGAVSYISFDNDLGTGNMEGYQALNVIEDKVYHGAPLPAMSVHSANNVAGPRMREVIAKLRAANDVGALQFKSSTQED